MAIHKRQHFVPQLYLRQFAENKDRKSICLFHLKSQKLIPGASLAGQCQQSYFYGTDLTTEKFLEELENKAAVIIERIMKSHMLPSQRHLDYVSLITFVLVLRARTQRAVIDFNSKLHKMDDTLYREYGQHDDRLLAFTENAPIHSIIAAINGVWLSADLECRLIVNDSRFDFLTSDNPVIYYNRLMEKKSAYGSHTGVACRGFQLFLPLSPREMLMLFDSGAYFVRSNEDRTVTLDNDRDVWFLNRLQFVQAMDSVYCTNQTEAELHELLRRSSKYRGGLEQIYRELRQANDSNIVFETRERSPKCGLELSFMRVTKRASHQPLSPTVAQLRDEGLCRHFNDFWEKMALGEYGFDEFPRFLTERDVPFES